jgi:succinate dehydrogenase/fumarate reductase flavoprotein subunit
LEGETVEELSRRHFLTGAAVVSGSLALAACSSQAPGASEAEDAPNGTEITWGKEADVVVVGSGTAGMTAAVSASDAGASVIVIEQFEITGGASVGCSAFACASTEPILSATSTTPNADTMFEELNRVGLNSADPELLRIVCDQSTSAIEFLVDKGVTFNDSPTNYGSYVRHGTTQGGMAVVTLTQLFGDAGGEILNQTRLIEIIRDDTTGRVLGIKATDRDGADLYIRADKALVIASGLWVNDEEMVRRHWPTIPPDVLAGGTVYAQQGIPFGPFDGTAIKAAQHVLAGVRHMEYLAGEPYYATLEYLEKGVATSGILRNTDEVHINLEGRRFYDESNSSRGAMSKEIARQTNNCYISIVDGKYIPAKMMGFYSQEMLDQWVADGDVISVDTIEELASRLEASWGVPAATVTETVRNYNDYCGRGVDPEFGKPAEFLVKLDTPPYWAGPLFTFHAMYSFGGLDADANARVRDIEGEVIPGLYACGFCAGGHFGQDGLTGGNQMNAVIFGRIAGQNAAAETA